MSSKKARRRREFAKREENRQLQEELKKDWRCQNPKCADNPPVTADSPICLCGNRRMPYCAGCGKPFLPEYWPQDICSKACVKRWERNMRLQPIVKRVVRRD